MAAVTASPGGSAVHAVPTTWTAFIQLQIPAGILVHPATINRALDVLRERGPSHAINDDQIFLGWGVTGATLIDAEKEALIYARTVADLLDIGIGGITAFRVSSNDEVIAKPDDPEVIGVHEAAEILGVSKQRIHQLVASDSTFPKPAGRIRATPWWRGADVRSYAAARRDKRRRSALAVP